MGHAPVMRFAVLAFVVASVIAHRPPVRAQSGTPLRARVVQASNTSTAIPRARITVSGADASRAVFYSDDEGRFAIEPAGTLTITRAGFVTQTVRLDRSSSAPIEIRLASGGIITGVAIDSQGRPAVAAAVRIMPVASATQVPGAPDPIIVYTNELGEFRAAGLAPGRYEVRTVRDVQEHRRLRTNEVRPPISAGFHGAPLPSQGPVPSQPLVVNVEANSQHVTLPYDDISLVPPDPSWTGTIDGYVFDEQGRPAEGIKVRLWYLTPNGPVMHAAQLGPSQATDDLGHFRLFHLQPGSYVVETVASDAWHLPGSYTELAPVYYPHATSVNQATRVNVTRGQEVTGVNIGFVRRRLARVYGAATDASGLPLNGTVALFGAPIAGGIRLPAREVPARNGSFEITNVAPGEYVLRVTRTQAIKTASSGNAAATSFTPASIAASEFGYRRISVGESDEGPVAVTTAPTATLAGRIVFERGAAPTSPIRLNLRPVDPAITPDVTPSLGFLVNDGRFEIPGFAGTSYLVYDGPPQWYVKSILTPVEIKGSEPIKEWVGEITVVLSSDMAAISGQVFDGTRPPVRRHYVQLFPVDEALRDRQQTGLLTAEGRYSFRNIVPGDYYLLAFDPTVPGLDLRATITSRGRRVTVQPGQELTFQTLQAFPGTK